MKIISHLTLFSTLSLAAVSCSSQKNTATVSQNANSTTTSTPATSQPTSSAPVAQVTTRFVVSFFSIGEGIDVKTHDEFVNFLNAYSPKIEYTPARWGREGEKDYCLGLTELSATQQAEFIKKAQEILAKSKLVNINENTKCEHTGAPITPAPAPTNDTYRLIVSFYSKGEGIDVKTKEEFVRFLNNYTKKIAFEPARWGREGEVDYCLKLNELSATEQTEFVKRSKELLDKSTLVHVDENAKCVHKH